MNLKISQSEKQQILEMHKKSTIKNYLSEQGTTEPKAGDPVTVDKLPQEFQNFVKTYGLTGTFNYAGDSQKGMGYEFGYRKGNVGTGFNLDEIKTYEQYKGDYQKCVKRGKKYDEILNNLMSGKSAPQQDPRMEEYCKQRPEDPRCQGTGKRMDERSARQRADKQINSLYPNMEYCGVVNKMQDIVTNMK